MPSPAFPPARRMPPLPRPSFLARPSAHAPAAAPPRSAATAAETRFHDAAQAWFWTLGCLAARHDGARGGGGGPRRPCEPDDILRALDRLHRSGRIDLAHARVLRAWGQRGMAPDPARAAEQAAARLWRQALEPLEAELRNKGIVG